MLEMDATSSTNESNEADVKECENHPGEPDAKRLKLSCSEVGKESSTVEKLEFRLAGILCCTVCLDLPKTVIYQCSNGHLMCIGCFTHLLADALIRNETATCPGCRTEISKTSVCRNLAVEKAVSELSAECQFCGKEYPRHSLDRHERNECEERLTMCQYNRIGCPWRGPHHERAEHERNCTHPHNTAGQILEVLDAADVERNKERFLYDSIFELLSFNKISFNDLQLKAYRTDEFTHKLYYETDQFKDLNQFWVVKARVNHDQRDPSLSCEREITYQVILKSKTSGPLNIHYVILSGPLNEIKVNPRIYKFDFTDEENESPLHHLPLLDTVESNRVLSSKTINFRLMMFQPTM